MSNVEALETLMQRSSPNSLWANYASTETCLRLII